MSAEDLKRRLEAMFEEYVEWNAEGPRREGFWYNCGEAWQLIDLHHKLREREMDPTLVCNIRVERDGAVNLYYTPRDPNWQDQVTSMVV